MAIGSPVLLLTLTGVSGGIAQAKTSAPAIQSEAGLTPAQAAALSRKVDDKVIVVFKDQVSALPDTPANASARRSDVASLQQGVRNVLSETHAANVHSISLVNAVAATVSAGTAALLQKDPAVAEVIPDRAIPVAADPATTIKTQARKSSPAATVTPLPGVCDTKQAQLNPEAIENIHAATASGKGASAQALGYTGAGVKVAFIADGLDIDNPDFIRADGKHVFVDYQDFSGTGTNSPTAGSEAFLDASSIAAQGREVYDVAGYSDPGLDTKCLIRILGVAPGASLVGLNVFGSSGTVFSSVFLEAIDYAVTADHVNVINESFGANPFPDEASLDLTELADDAAVKAGVTVTVSSGDAGVTNTIGSPATDPHVISAGATTTYRAYAQAGIGGITAAKGYLDNNISGLSSGGFAQTGATVDVVAPGDLNWALCTADTAKYGDCRNFNGTPTAVELSGGTSEAAPLTAGTAALVIQAYREAHHGATPSPAVVKQAIVSTAENIGAPAEQQGAGLIDAYQAVLAARSYPDGSSQVAGQPLLDSKTQFNAVAPADTTEYFTEKLTNTGLKPVTLTLSSRTLSPYATVTAKSVKLDDANDDAAAVTFTVKKGQARLNASAAFVGIVALSLISPSGKLAAYNLPQGVGNYGDVQVSDPQAGTWTALINSEGSGGTVKFQAGTATWAKFGRLSTDKLTLTPGTKGEVTLTVRTPAEPGDQSGAIDVRSGADAPGFTTSTTIPVTLRSLVPAPDPSVTVTGTLTGGNGRNPSTGQTAYYQVRIPAGRKALNVSVATGDPENTLFAELVDPNGNVLSAAANDLLTSDVTGDPMLTLETGAQLHARRPAAGLYTVIVDFYESVSGTAVAQPFTMTLDDTPVRAGVTGLPDSAATKLAAGKPVTVSVSVHNGGSTPEAYFVDPRLDRQATISLATQTTSSVTLPNLFGTVPDYVVPSHTTSVKATVSAPAKQLFDLAYTYGDPDLASTSGKTTTVTYSAHDVPSGIWGVTPFLLGPTGASQAQSVTATVSLQATTAAFDPAASPATGDLWAASTDELASFTPYVVQPGQTAVIPVTITPKGAAGTTVSGTLYVADSSFVSSLLTFDYLEGLVPEGSDVAQFPYRYTIG